MKKASYALCWTILPVLTFENTREIFSSLMEQQITVYMFHDTDLYPLVLYT